MSVTFACYFPAERPLFIPIRIDSDAWVAQLSKQIAAKLKELGQGIRYTDLCLFKTGIPLEPDETLQWRALQWLHQQPKDGQLKMTTKLSLVFPGGPHQSDDNLKLDFIIANAEVVEMSEGLGNPDDVYKRKVKTGAYYAGITDQRLSKRPRLTGPVEAEESRPYDVRSTSAEATPMSQTPASMSVIQKAPPIIKLNYYILGDRGDRILPIELLASATVYDLMQAVKTERSRPLKKANVAHLTIYKLSPPLPITIFKNTPPPASLAELGNVTCQCLESPLKLSVFFPNPTEPEQLDIIVEVDAQLFTISPSNGNDRVSSQVAEDEPPNKKPRLVGPDDAPPKWNHLWLTFWGKLALECTVERSVRIPDVRTLDEAQDETKYQYLALPNDGSFPCGLRRILITGTYKSLYDKLCEQDKVYIGIGQLDPLISLSHSTVITGQPGTGKTAGLSCILVWRLQQKKPTVYCSDTRYAYVFNDSGVQRVSLERGERIKALDESNHCCGLVDINPALIDVPSQFHPNDERLGRVVVATSPNPEHVTAFKQNRARTYYTPIWKWGDLYCASLLLRSPLAAESLRDMYVRLGGIPRRCFRALFPDGKEDEMRTIAKAIGRIKDIQELAYSANGRLPFKDDMSHVLVRTEPTDDKWQDQVTDLLSGYVAELVYDRISLYNTMKIKDPIEGFLRIPGARSWGGKLFERGVHRTFREGITFETVAMDGDAPALSVQIRKAKNEAYDYFHNLSVRAKPGSRNMDEDILHRYLIPLSSTAETIDAVYISDTVTVLMQITVSPNHDLKLKGITELVNELPFAAKKRICILFVVPDHETTARPYKRQTIVVPTGVSADVAKMEVRYNQYVYYFPMALLQAN